MSAQEDLRAAVDAVISQGGDFVPAVVADKVLATVDRATIATWLNDNAARFLTADISTWLRSERSRARHHAKAATFGEAVEAGSVGEFSVVYEVDGDHTRRTVADMTAQDHRFVASAYHRSAKADLMFAAFHEAVARKLGRKTTAQAMTEAQYVRLMRSISGEPDDKAA